MCKSVLSAARFVCAIGVALPALMVAAPIQTHAFELFGVKIFGSDKTDNTDDVIGIPQPYTIETETTGEIAELKDTVKNASSLWSARKKPASGAAGLIAMARGDYRRILDAFYAQAYYGPTISITIDGHEVSGLRPDAVFADPAIVKITVNPGPLFHFSKADIINRAPPTQDDKDKVPGLTKDEYIIGQPARSGVIISSGRRAVEEWRQQGYPKALISQESIVADHSGATIESVLRMDSGPYAVFGPVTVSGTERMDPEFVAYMTGLVPGQEYDPDYIAAARERMGRLDVFRASRFEEAETVNADGTLPMNLVVQERPSRRIGVGGTYSTVDGLGIEAFWLHRNLFGRAERLRLEGKISGLGETFDPKKLTYRLGATFTKPGIYTPDTDFVASLFADREVLERYTRTGITAQSGFNHKFSDEISGRLFLNGGYSQFDDDYGTREFTTIGTMAGLTYDTRDDTTNATKGIYADVSVEPYYEFNFGNAAARVLAEARGYYSVDKESRFVLAGRVKIGAIFDPPLDETPPDKLFFAGGGGSVRGYAYRNIGVDTPAGVGGGRSLIEGSAEIRARVTQDIGIVAFADAGYVGADAIPDFTENLRIGVGAGIRYLTGFGPIRLDVATPLNRRPGDPTVAVYVGIGQSF